MSACNFQINHGLNYHSESKKFLISQLFIISFGFELLGFKIAVFAISHFFIFKHYGPIVIRKYLQKRETVSTVETKYSIVFRFPRGKLVFVIRQNFLNRASNKIFSFGKKTKLRSRNSQLLTSKEVSHRLHSTRLKRILSTRTTLNLRKWKRRVLPVSLRTGEDCIIAKLNIFCFPTKFKLAFKQVNENREWKKTARIGQFHKVLQGLRKGKPLSVFMKFDNASVSQRRSCSLQTLSTQNRLPA